MIEHPYRSQFDRIATALPPAERSLREAALARFVATGFPNKELEDWRYTDLSVLGERSFELEAAASFDPRPELLADADHLVFVNGRYDTDHSTLPATVPPPSEPRAEGIGPLNAAFATGGAMLEVPRGSKLARPVQILLVSSATTSAMIHQRHRIRLGESAEATVLLQFAGAGGDRLATHVVDIELAAGARLTLYRLQDEGAGMSLVTDLRVQQARDSRFEVVTVDIGSGLARHDLRSELAAPGAENDSAGLYAPRAGAHVDNHLATIHAAAHCRSRSHYRGIIDAHVKAVFNGKVIVQPGAQKTDSEQRIANLLLSRKAEVNAKPELEIYADDVKCAHGATVGQLDEKALAYLRSRGIPRDTARALLLRAFATEILDRITWPGLRARIEAALQLPSEMPEILEP